MTIEEERSLKLLIRGWKRSLVCNEGAGGASVGFVRRLNGWLETEILQLRGTSKNRIGLGIH